MHDEAFHPVALSPGCCARVENRRRLGHQRRLSHLAKNRKNTSEKKIKECNRLTASTVSCSSLSAQLGTIRFVSTAFPQSSSLIGSFGCATRFLGRSKSSAHSGAVCRLPAVNGGCFSSHFF